MGADNYTGGPNSRPSWFMKRSTTEDLIVHNLLGTKGSCALADLFTDTRNLHSRTHVVADWLKNREEER